MSTDPSSETTAQRFGRLVGDAARRAGYDIDSPRGGGKTALARAAGMTESSVGRMLAGKTLPDPKKFQDIARAVHLPVRDLLVEAGIVSPQALTENGPARVASEITPEEAARRLGITDPTDRELFLGVVARLRRHPTADETDNGNDRGGDVAHG